MADLNQRVPLGPLAEGCCLLLLLPWFCLASDAGFRSRGSFCRFFFSSIGTRSWTGARAPDVGISTERTGRICALRGLGGRLGPG